MCTKRFVIAGLTALALVIPSGVSSAQTADPIEDPTGLLASDNVALHTVLPGPAAIGARFRGNLMYLTTSSGLAVYDVSDPVAPTEVGRLALPHFENEDVDLGGNILLISNDAAESAGLLHIVNISDPANLTYTTYDMKSTAAEAQLSGGPGHTASCILDCTFTWVTDGGKLRVIDLRDPAAPVTLGSFDTPAGGGAFPTHDVQVDENGLAWVVGFGGAAAYQLPADYADAATAASAAGPAALTAYHASLLVTKTNKQGESTYDDLPEDPTQWPGDFGGAGDGSKHNDFILHNSRRLLDSDVLYVTEEDYNRPGCKGAGSFETWRIPMREEVAPDGTITKVITGEPLTPLDKWETEMLAQDTSASALHPTAMCSAHYFDIKQNVVAQGWYEQGLRFLDVSDPADVRQVGYFIPPNAESWAAYFPPTDETGRIVYMLDVSLGLAVLEYDRPTEGPLAMPAEPTSPEPDPTEDPTEDPGDTQDEDSDEQKPSKDERDEPKGGSEGDGDQVTGGSSGSGSGSAVSAEAKKKSSCKAKKTKKARKACRKRRQQAGSTSTAANQAYEPTVVAPVRASWLSGTPASAPSSQFGYACRIVL